ncbi:biotin--[acetyl-CoA-carboxylase] ligase [Mucilaginibacter roseus]|uniref:Biotin--[acetyl-CoA-carboxylase] ligase n=1 Tax=Mucilaginibacter roseus TaxID=1528868 RepID=A0ABS8U633_9SPHI|nr:biotin--[acetyl-CoA-carboxylase] ligase [Mucilaginibacter roseus]MCD8741287.1 biotin--[acetyl-CoA-carboxylase] ligase [Mucilaginibacter roseus]
MQSNIFSGLFVGRNLVTLKQVDSTNTFLKNLLANSTPVSEGTVIMAEEQFAGRGQRQNTWYAQPGKNITASILLNPSFLNINNQFDLNRAVSVGIQRALKPILGNKLKVKWPNDIYYDDYKVGGILIENILFSNILKHAIVGIGLNVNQDEFPQDVTNASSVKQILHRDYDLKVLLSDLCSGIEAAYLELKAGKVQELRNEYTQYLYGLNEKRQFKSNNYIFDATITGVAPNGLLVLQNENEELTFDLKELEFLNPTT